MNTTAQYRCLGFDSRRLHQFIPRKHSVCGVTPKKPAHFLHTLMVLASLLLMPSQSSAELQILIGSMHFGDSPRDVSNEKKQAWDFSIEGDVIDSGWNQFNPGLLYFDNGNYYGAYLNSVDRVSLAAGKYHRFTDHVSVSAGIATNYGKALPVLPQIAVHYTQNRIRLTLSPYLFEHGTFNVESSTGIEKYRDEVTIHAGIVAGLSVIY